MSTDARLDRRTLRERTIAAIRQLIISGRLEPGEHVVEVRLSDELLDVFDRSALRWLAIGNFLVEKTSERP